MSFNDLAKKEAADKKASQKKNETADCNQTTS